MGNIAKDIVKDNKKFLLLVLLLVVVCVLAMFSLQSGWYSSGLNIDNYRDTYSKPTEVLEPNVDYQISVKTVYGSINIDLYEDSAPKNVNSLLFLIGERYYEDLTFHKVAQDFVIQAGDTQGDGNGDPGYTVPLENSSAKFEVYSVGMANASQFFIVLPGANRNEIQGNYTLVGEVTTGFDVVDSIAKVEVDNSNYKPINDVSISSIQILEQ